MEAHTLSEKEIYAYRRAALYHAHKIAFTPEDAEDIASQVMLKFVSADGPPPAGHPLTVTWHATIDAVRQLYGRVGEERAFTKSQFYAVSFDARGFDGEEHRPLSETIAAPEPSAQQAELVGIIMNRRLPPLHQGILLLQLLWGFTGEELARIFGVTPQWIAQLKMAAISDVTPVPHAATSHRTKESRLTAHVRELQDRVAELEARKDTRDVAELKTRIRHLEIILEAKGISHEVHQDKNKRPRR